MDATVTTHIPSHSAGPASHASDSVQHSHWDRQPCASFHVPPCPPPSPCCTMGSSPTLCMLPSTHQCSDLGSVGRRTAAGGRLWPIASTIDHHPLRGARIHAVAAGRMPAPSQPTSLPAPLRSGPRHWIYHLVCLNPRLLARYLVRYYVEGPTAQTASSRKRRRVLRRCLFSGRRHGLLRMSLTYEIHQIESRPFARVSCPRGDGGALLGDEVM